MLGATWVADIWDDPKKRLLSWEEKKANVPVYKRIYHETQGALISFYLKRADMGKIVVASRLPRIAKIIEHGKTGFLYDPHDTAAAAEIIGKIKKNPKRYKNMGAAAREAVKQYDGAGIIDKIFEHLPY